MNVCFCGESHQIEVPEYTPEQLEKKKILEEIVLTSATDEEWDWGDDQFNISEFAPKNETPIEESK
jgi:hypothetical protein